MNRLSTLITTLLAVVFLFATGCKKNNDNGGTPSSEADFYIDVDFLPETETNGELAPRLMANINDELVMIELRPSADSLVETVLLLGPDNYAMMLCGNDQLMICAEYDMETYTPSDEVLLVTSMADTALLLTKCVMDWNTNAITTGDMMILPVHDFDRNKRGTNDIDGDIRKYFFNTFVKPLAASFEEVEHFCNMLGIPAAGVFASIRLIITTELTEILFSDDPENTYENTTHQFTSSIAGQVSSYVLNLFPQKYHAIVSKILAAIAWYNDGGHGEVNHYQGNNNGDEWSMYGSYFYQAYNITEAASSYIPSPIYIVGMNVSHVTESSAFLKGSFSFGSSNITPGEMGYIYSVNGGTEYAEEDMGFNGITITGLQKATKYVVQAYVATPMGDVVFSPAVTFVTLGFETFPNSLSFPAEGDTKYVSVLYSPTDITSIEITSCPSWCSVTHDELGLLAVTVGETTETRSGTITVTGHSLALGSVTEDITVTQYGTNDWNGTAWFFEGTITTVWGNGDTSPFKKKFSIKIFDISNNDIIFDVSQNQQSAENTISYSENYTLDENGVLIFTSAWDGIIDLVYGGTAIVHQDTRITFSRTSPYTATADWYSYTYGVHQITGGTYPYTRTGTLEGYGSQIR